MEFKDRLKAEIRASGLTQKEVAIKVGVSEHTIGNWLYGRSPMLPQYEKLLGVFPTLRDREIAS